MTANQNQPGQEQKSSWILRSMVREYAQDAALLLLGALGLRSRSTAKEGGTEEHRYTKPPTVITAIFTDKDERLENQLIAEAAKVHIEREAKRLFANKDGQEEYINSNRTLLQIRFKNKLFFFRDELAKKGKDPDHFRLRLVSGYQDYLNNKDNYSINAMIEMLIETVFLDGHFNEQEFLAKHQHMVQELGLLKSAFLGAKEHRTTFALSLPLLAIVVPITVIMILLLIIFGLPSLWALLWKIY